MSRRSWGLFALVSLLWGVPYLFIKIAVVELPPSWVVLTRLVLAAAVLVPIAWYRGALRPFRGRLGALTVQGLLHVGIPFWLITAGEQYIGSGLAALLISSTPAMIAVIELAVPPKSGSTERLTWVRGTGLLVGLAGVALLVGPDASSENQLLGTVMLLLATAGYAVATVNARRRFSDVPALGLSTGTVLVGAVTMLPLALTEIPTRLPSVNTMLAVAVLGTLCTAVAFVGFYALLKVAGPARASVITYISPLVAAGLGVAVLDEPLTGGLLAGSVLILAGSWLATRRPRAARPAAERSGGLIPRQRGVQDRGSVREEPVPLAE